jgi:hypothetical protein
MLARMRLIALLLLSISVFAAATWAGIAIIDGHQEAAMKDRQIAAFQQAGRVKDQQINTLIALNRTLLTEVKASNARTTRHDAASAHKLSLVLHQLSALSHYLRSRGILVPTRFLAVSGVAAISSTNRNVIRGDE